MLGLVYPVTQSYAHREHPLLDTADHYDAWDTGRDGPEDHIDGCGLLMIYDGTGTVPSIRVNGPDGEIEFIGIDEIRAVSGAMRSGLRLAEAFGAPIPLLQWRRLNG